MTKKEGNPATPPSEPLDTNTMKDSIPEVKELSFEDTAIQFKNSDGKWRTSLRLLAEYYDIKFSHASEKLTGNSDFFRDLGTDRITRSANGSVYDYDLSIRDAVSFLTLVNYKRYKDERREKLIRMRNWLTDTAEKLLMGETVTLTSPSQTILLSDSLKEEMKRADAMTIIGVDISRAASACLAKLEDQFGEPLDYLRALVARRSDEDIPTLTATEIGKELGLSAQSVNNILEKLGYQKHDYRIKKTGAKQKVWNLTQSGKVYGEIILERHGGADVQYILWRREIVEVVRRAVFLDEEQSTLEEEA
jgi:hypothetical protein